MKIRKSIEVMIDILCVAIFIFWAGLWGFGFAEPSRWAAASAACFAAIYWVHLLERDIR